MDAKAADKWTVGPDNGKKTCGDTHSSSISKQILSKGGSMEQQENAREPSDLLDFHKMYGWKNDDDAKPRIKEKLTHIVKEKIHCDQVCFLSYLFSFLPIIRWLPMYSLKKYLLMDTLGGLTVGIVCIPQGLAYANLAGMPTVTGLYMSIIPPLVYLFFGTCRHASPGAVTLLALMMGNVRYRLLPSDDYLSSSPNVSFHNSTQNSSGTLQFDALTPLDIGCTMAFLMGVILILMGAVHLDILTTYLSDQVVTGFTVGAGVHIFSAQLDSIFGIKSVKSSGPGKLFLDYAALFRNIHNTNYATLIISLITIIFLIFIKFVVNPRVQKKIRGIPLPGELFAVIVGVLVSYFVHVKEVYKVSIVENIPAAFPSVSIPRFDIMQYILMDAFVFAVITYCQSIFQAKLCGKNGDYYVDSRQEFFAYGLSNVIGAFFQNFNSGLSISRTIVCEKTGAKTQINALVGVGVVIVTILCIAKYLALLPQGILAAIIMVACIDMFRQLKELKYIWKVSKIDFVVYVITVLSIVVFDITYGLIISVFFNIFSSIIRTQWYVTDLLRFLAPQTELTCTPKLIVILRYYCLVTVNLFTIVYYFKEVPGMKIVHFEAPLYYANVESFKAKLYRSCSIIDTSKTSSFKNGKIKNSSVSLNNVTPLHIVIDCSGFIYVDLMGIDLLKQIYTDLTQMGIDVLFAQFNGSVQNTLEKSNFFKIVPNEKLFVTIRDAVAYAKKSDNNIANSISNK